MFSHIINHTYDLFRFASLKLEWREKQMEHGDHEVLCRNGSGVRQRHSSHYVNSSGFRFWTLVSDFDL